MRIELPDLVRDLFSIESAHDEDTIRQRQSLMCLQTLSTHLLAEIEDNIPFLGCVLIFLDGIEDSLFVVASNREQVEVVVDVDFSLVKDQGEFGTRMHHRN